MTTILLTGASGFVGSNIQAALALAGHRVIPVSRRHGVDMSKMRSVADWLPLLAGVDAVINTVGIIGETAGQTFEQLHTRAPVSLFQACQKAGVRRVIQISAQGADDTAFSAYHLSKRAADDALRSLDLAWFVLRPSLIYGKGGTSAELFLRVAKLPVIPVLGSGRQTTQPVHISDVVATVMRCLTTTDVRQTIDVVGPETIGFGDWLQTLRRAQGRPNARLLHVPYGLVCRLAALGSYVSPMVRVDNVRMLNTGYDADVRPLERFLGRPPLAATPELIFTNVAPSGSAP